MENVERLRSMFFPVVYACLKNGSAGQEQMPPCSPSLVFKFYVRAKCFQKQLNESF